LALGNVVTVDEQADEDEAPRDVCVLNMYQTAVPYHNNHDDRNKSRSQKYLILTLLQNG